MRLKDCIAVVGGARLLVKLFPRSKQALERACYYHTASFAALTGLISRVAQFFRPVQTFPALNFPADINTHLAPMFGFPGTTIDGQTVPVSPRWRRAQIATEPHEAELPAAIGAVP